MRFKYFRWFEQVGCFKGDAKKIQNGSYVICFVGRSLAQVEADEADLVYPEKVYWVHLGFMKLSPHWPSWHLLNGPHASIMEMQQGAHRLVSKLESASFWIGLKPLERDLRWDMFVFELDDLCRPIGTVRANNVVVGGMCLEHAVWNPWGRGRRRMSWNFNFNDDSDDDDDQAGQDELPLERDSVSSEAHKGL